MEELQKSGVEEIRSSFRTDKSAILIKHASGIGE